MMLDLAEPTHSTGLINLEDIELEEDELIRSICEDSFYDFVKEFWSEIINEDPVWNWHIEYLCTELQKVGENLLEGKSKLYDLLINIPPGTTKSTIISQMFPAWMWIRMASCRFICATHTDSLTVKLSQLSKDIIKSEKYQRIFPEIRVRKDTDNKAHFKNTKGGERISTSVGAKVTGNHAHFIIIDDPLDPEQALSEADMKKANRFVQTVLPSRKVSKERSVMILLMQRLHQDDPSARWMVKMEKGQKIKHICLPATKSDKIRPAKLARKYVDNLLDPIRLNEQALLDAEADLGQYAYAGQFDQHPVPAGGGMFKTANLQKRDKAPRIWKQRRVRYWDKAGTQDGGCFSAGVLMGQDMQGNFWILHVNKGQWGTDEREDQIEGTAETDQTLVRIGLEQEPGSGGKESAEATVKRLAGFSVKVDRPVGNKIYRADPFSVQVNRGNVYILNREWTQDFIDEMKYFPNSKYKDQIDAGSGAFAMLAGPKKRVGAMKRSK